ncbi:MAG: phage tail protein [Burkholderiales bacterium]|nr:MAG: phage tail protein [Burkholderiales bacterium]
MPTSTAISAQGSTFSIEGTPGGALTITAITKATSAVVTATNTLSVGDVVEFGTVTGMPEIFGLLGIVTAATGTNFTVNIDSSGYATAGTTGAANPKTWTQVNNVKTYSGFDGSASELDKTNLSSGAMEYAAGLQDFGQFSITVDVDDTDAGQMAMRAAKTSAATKAFRLRLPNGKQRVFKGFVKKFSEEGGVNQIVKASADIRITGVVNFG